MTTRNRAPNRLVPATADTTAEAQAPLFRTYSSVCATALLVGRRNSR
jgi:hypothetical protein